MALPGDLDRLLDEEQGWPVPMSEAEYLEFERRSRWKHEYVDGLVWLWSGYDVLDSTTGLAGASEEHNLIRGNIFAWARPLARAAGCRVFFSEMRFRARTGARYFYPDLMAVCEDGPEDTRYDKTRPCFIVEVLSPGQKLDEFRAERIELADKLQAYQSVPSMQTYLIVAQRQRRVIWHQRDADGSWRVEMLTAGGVSVACLGGELSLETILRSRPDCLIRGTCVQPNVKAAPALHLRLTAPARNRSVPAQYACSTPPTGRRGSVPCLSAYTTYQSRGALWPIFFGHFRIQTRLQQQP